MLCPVVSASGRFEATVLVGLVGVFSRLSQSEVV